MFLLVCRELWSSCSSPGGGGAVNSAGNDIFCTVNAFQLLLFTLEAGNAASASFFFLTGAQQRSHGANIHGRLQHFTSLENLMKI